MYCSKSNQECFQHLEVFGRGHRPLFVDDFQGSLFSHTCQDLQPSCFFMSLMSCLALVRPVFVSSLKSHVGYSIFRPRRQLIYDLLSSLNLIIPPRNDPLTVYSPSRNTCNRVIRMSRLIWHIMVVLVLTDNFVPLESWSLLQP